LVGERWGEAYGLGDRLKVELVEADVATGGLLFRLVEHTPGPTARLAAKGHKRNGGKRPAAAARAKPDRRQRERRGTTRRR
ncbi:MAG TPA: ribonuclease R, partial [Geminicoccaceae bacterium]|nr:ribonuclease R [Geminicoccaceae bacterium]